MKRPVLRKRLYVGACLVAVAFLGFVGGAYTTFYRTWPYPIMRGPLVAARAWQVKYQHPGKYSWYFYSRARTTATGVRCHDPERAFEGLTLFSSGHSQQAYLVAMDGQIVHQWQRPLSEIWPKPQHLPNGLPPDEYVVVRKTHLYPNGDLLALYAQGGGTPWGCGLAKLDKDSRVIWSYAELVHHDVQVGHDGRIYTLAQAVLTEPIAGLPARVVPPLVEDYVVVLSPTGQELSRLSVTEAFRNSAFATVLQRPRPGPRGDLWHTNAVQPLSPELAAAFPMFEAGQVLISLRTIDTVAVLDLDARKAVWAARGCWRRQHDPDFLPNGNILIFDNDGPDGPAPASRLIELNPRTRTLEWEYRGSQERPFHSEAAGGQQRLPNGNTLITESNAGRIFEVTADGEIVWEYLSPFRAPHDPKLVGIVHRAQRYDPASLESDWLGPAAGGGP